jgi:hypothetical protein
MALTVKQRIETFELEWSMRERMLLLGGFSDKEIAEHRKDILHRYQLTDGDLQKAGIYTDKGEQ